MSHAHIKITQALLGGLLLLLLGSCSSTSSSEEGGSGNGSEQNESGTVCPLLTTEDLEAEGLRVIGEPTRVSGSAKDECIFETEPSGGSDSPGAVTVTIYPQREGAALSPDAFGDSEPIVGVGTEAWLSQSARAAQARLPDGTAVGITMLEVPPQGAREVLIPLITKLAERASNTDASPTVDDEEKSQDP